MITTLIAGMALAVAQTAPEITPAVPPAQANAAKPASPKSAPVSSETDALVHIRKALAFEARGLPQGRARELKAALAVAPSNPVARGLLGLVDYAGSLKSPDEVVASVKSDSDLAAKLAEYNARRDKTPEKASAHLRLAVWCKQNGLADEARAHFTAVTRLNPKDAEAWKALGCKRFNGRWMTPEAIETLKQDARDQSLADRRWTPLLARWKRLLLQPANRDEAAARLDEIDDPRAVPAVWATFITPEEPDQRLAVQLLGQIDAASATRGLADLAIHSPHAEVRRLARETLARRDPRDYMDAMIARIRKPLVITGVQRPQTPGGAGVILVEGEQFNVQRMYQTTAYVMTDNEVNSLTGPDDTQPFPAAQPAGSSSGAPSPFQSVANNPGNDPGAILGALVNYGAAKQAEHNAQGVQDLVADTPNGLLPNMRVDMTRNTRNVLAEKNRMWARENLAQAELAFIATQQQMSKDLALIAEYNVSVAEINDRVIPALRGLTKQDFGADAEAWRAWWTDRQGYAYRSPEESVKPVVSEFAETVTPNFQQLMNPRAHSCFAAGTMVRTREGSRPIESLRSGDVVLAQDPRTGSLGYQPVLRVHHNPPASTLKVRLDGNKTVVATPIHRFWQVGKGWKMARELEPGDLLRLYNGTVRVASIDDDKVQPVFNLEVADAHSFFVGESGALVHDNSLVNTVFTPFDADAPKLASAAEAR
ncbi:polymorphic toxin-type HINT domain-containing protein [Isosphaeraceae bacterium EP7]